LDIRNDTIKPKYLSQNAPQGSKFAKSTVVAGYLPRIPLGRLQRSPDPPVGFQGGKGVGEKEMKNDKKV